MKMMLLGAVALMAVAACNQAAPPSALNSPVPTASSTKAGQSHVDVAGTLPLPEVKLDLSSPDRALKTFFAFQDRHLVAEFNEAVRQRASDTPHPDAGAAAVFEGPAKRYIDAVLGKNAQAAVLERYERDIAKVEAESETRAIVLANIKNITPVAAGSVLDKYDLKWRSEGFNFRYVMGKTSEGWKIEDVQEWELDVNTVKHGWKRSRKIPAAEPGPRVYGMVSSLF
jgi:hypothetical protein